MVFMKIAPDYQEKSHFMDNYRFKSIQYWFLHLELGIIKTSVFDLKTLLFHNSVIHVSLFD